MKRLLVGISVVIAIFVGILLATYHLDKIVEDVLERVDKSLLVAQNQDFESAEGALREAMALWYKNQAYAGICLRHSELSSISDAFFDMLERLKSEELDAALISGEALRYKLRTIQMMEHPSLASIF